MPIQANSKQRMQLQERINAFEQLGLFLADVSNESHESFPEIERAYHHNGWFTFQNIKQALKSWSEALNQQSLMQWTQSYSFPSGTPKKVAIIMAGNIPMVGFHDFVSVLISGHHVLAKLSSNDRILLPFIANKLIEIEPRFKDRIQFSEEKLTKFDAVIATGSNNTATYFEYYFGKYPNIIRKNRNSVAILDGLESKKDLEGLADDIFQYFGLGCRNVSKLYLPEGYDFEPFFQAMYRWKEIINNDKYMNNYDYNKTVYLMSNIPLLDNEFMLLKEDPGFASPIAVVYYEYYNNLSKLHEQLQQKKEEIQCVVSKQNNLETVSFGSTQSPQLWDYADGIDTLAFLNGLS